MSECIYCNKPVLPWQRWEWALCGFNQREHKRCHEARNQDLQLMGIDAVDISVAQQEIHSNSTDAELAREHRPELRALRKP